jgi:hypothetical protein
MTVRFKTLESAEACVKVRSTFFKMRKKITILITIIENEWSILWWETDFSFFNDQKRNISTVITENVRGRRKATA